jgi:hypothetical protein
MFIPNMAVAITEESASDQLPLPSSWHRSAPLEVVKRYRQDDLRGAWKSWQKHLARRKSPQPAPFLDGRKPPLLWGWPADWYTDALRAVLQSPDYLVDCALPDGHTAIPRLPRTLEPLAAAYALPVLARQTTAETWWRLVARLRNLAIEAQQQTVGWPADPSDVVQQQLLAAELPLALGYLFPEVCALRALRKAARAVLSESMLQLTDGEGMPHASLLPVLGPLFACWTRARWLGERLPKSSWSRQAENQYQWLVRHAIRLADAGGRFVLTSGIESPAAWSPAMFAMALDLAGDKRDCAAANTAIGAQAIPNDLGKVGRPPKSSVNSEWSGIAIMADGWSQSSTRLAVAYADEPIQLELTTRGKRLLEGPWTFETSCDGNLVRIASDWENLFWSSAKSYVMLELGVRLSEGLRLERQLLLARDDQVLFLADVVISIDGTPRRITHTSYLPLDNDVQWQAESETRDGLLRASQHHAAVLPLALPEWRTDPRGGSLVEASGRLALTHEAHGRALYCPLLIDLKNGRAQRERTWRQLTVAESMEVLPRDIAVGFRAQCGRHQWLFYRSIGTPGNRTVLGQNIAGEFCAGRFRTTGKLDEWIEIEPV